MKDIIIAKRYASAALKSLNTNKYIEILDQLYYIKMVFTENPKAIKILTSKIIRKEHKVSLIKSVTEEIKNKDFWQQMFFVLIKKNRIDLLELFFGELEKSLFQVLNQEQINLIFARQQEKETIDNIKKSIEKILNKKVIYNIQIDEELIGGFVAKSRNKVIDASIRSNLNRFAKMTLNIQ